MKKQEITISPFFETDNFFAIYLNGRYWDVCRSQNKNIDWELVEDFSEKFMNYADIHDFKRIMEHLEKRSQKRGEIISEEDQQIITRLHNRIAIFEVPDKIFEQKYIKLNNEKGKLEEYVSVFIWNTDKINWEHIAHAVEYYRSINKKIALKRMLNKLNKEILHMEFSELEAKIESVIQEQKQKEEESKQEDQKESKTEPIIEPKLDLKVIKRPKVMPKKNHRKSTIPKGLSKELIIDSIDLRKDHLVITLQQ